MCTYLGLRSPRHAHKRFRTFPFSSPVMGERKLTVVQKFWKLLSLR